jgi:cytochrome c-type biogenesis protein CcmH/NrfG
MNATKFAPGAAWVLAVLAWSAVTPAYAHDDGAACANNPAPAIVAARASLAKTPASLETRFGLADALIEANCYEAAVHTLEEGQALHPGSAGLQAKLRTTRSLVNEQGYFAGLEQAEVAARVSRNLLRCSRLGDLTACDEALKLKPEDVDILVAKGDAQLKAGKPADAEQTYRRAKQLAPDNAKANTQLAAAHAQRLAALSNCQTGSDDAALASCQAALLRGADDEFAVHTRLAQIYQQRNQPAPALTSYIAANTLKRGDRNVALGIVALTDSGAHRDAVTFAARGAALLTLKRGSEALAALRQAQTLAPGMPELRAQLAQAETLAKNEKPRAAPAGGTSALIAAAGAAMPAEPARRYSNSAEPSRSN